MNYSKTLVTSIVVLLVIIVLSALLMREEKKAQPPAVAPLPKETAVVGQPRIVDLPMLSAVGDAAITIVKRPSKEKEAAFLEKLEEKRAENRKRIEDQLIASSRSIVPEPAPVEEQPGNTLVGITNVSKPSAKPPTKEEIQEMNARGIVMY